MRGYFAPISSKASLVLYCRLALFCFLCGVKTIENGASWLRKSLGKRRGVDALMLGDFDVLDPYHEDWTLALVWGSSCD